MEKKDYEGLIKESKNLQKIAQDEQKATMKRLQQILHDKLVYLGFSNVKQMVRNYSQSRFALQKAIDRCDRIIAQEGR